MIFNVSNQYWGRTLTREDLMRFFAAKNLRPMCPECGLNDWTFSGLDRGAPAFMLVEELPGARSIDNHLPVVMLICNNCGHLRCFHKNVILTWIERNSPPGVFNVQR